jgi:ABC-type branched-subunit amino acid transport system substrate-binding protein
MNTVWGVDGMAVRCMPRRVSLAVGWLAVLTLAACAGLGGEARPSNAERVAFDRAMSEGSAQPDRARAALEDFVARHPNGALVGDAQVQLGDLAKAEGDVEGAMLAWFKAIRVSRGSAADRARLRVAKVEWERGQLDEARAALGKLRYSRLEREERREAYSLQAQVAPDPVARVRWLAFERSETPADELESLDAEIDSTLESLDTPNLARIARQLGGKPPAARVWMIRAERALDAGRVDDARAALERAQDRPLDPRYAERLAGVAQRLDLRTAAPVDIAELPTFGELVGRVGPETRGARGTLGVVLPLSGSFARFGEESLHGILLAARIFGGPDDEGGLRIVVRDSAGDPARAEAAVRELASDGDVTAIVGPLLSAESEAAARVAEEYEIPLLALTAREEIAQSRAFVFRLRTRPIEEAQVLVERARAAGAERFAILYRNDNYGRGLRALFWDAVEARGGRVVAVSGFDPQAKDFAGPIRRLVGYTLLTSQEKSAINRREGMLSRARRLPAAEARALRARARGLTGPDGTPLPPIVDFDALFIAESYENVVLIAPQLAFHEVNGPRLLGPDGWYHDDLVRVGREHVEGSMFVAHYFPGSDTPYVKDFADRYETTYGHESNVFGAQAYDAANLVFVQLARGSETRQAVRDGVLATAGYPGVSGVLSMRPDGNAQKRPFVLGVEKGRVIQLDD